MLGRAFAARVDRGVVELAGHLRHEPLQTGLFELVVAGELLGGPVQLEALSLEAQGVAHPAHELGPARQLERDGEPGTKEGDETALAVRCLEAWRSLGEGVDGHGAMGAQFGRRDKVLPRTIFISISLNAMANASFTSRSLL